MKSYIYASCPFDCPIPANPTGFSPTTSHKDITIESLKEKIEFEKGSKTNPVLIKHSFETSYKCNDYCTSTLYVESFNDQESIEDVDIFVNGKKVTKNIAIQQEAYSSEGIFYSDQKVMYFTLPLTNKGISSEVRIKKND